MKCGEKMEEQVVEKKENNEQKNMPLFILKIVGNVVFYLIIILLLLFSIMNIRAGNRNDGFPNIFGKGFLSVQTSSMDGDKEDSFKAGDLLIVSVFKEKNFDSLEVGQVVTFYDPTVNNNQGGLNSHRIVYIHRDAKGHIDSLAVQGDKSVKDYNWTYNPDDQSDAGAKANQSLISSQNVQNLKASQIKGVMTSVWHGAGTVMDNLQRYWLFIFVLPVLLFLIFEVFMVVRNVMALKGEKQKVELETAKVDLETQKEELRAQILAELRAEQLKENNPEAETTVPEEAEVVTDAVEEESLEPAAEELPVEPEPVKEETPAEDVSLETPAVEEPVEEKVLGPVNEEISPEDTAVKTENAEEAPKTKAPAKKTTTAKKTTGTKSTTTKKSTGTKSTSTKSSAAKKTSTGTKAATTKKSTGTKSTSAKKTTTTRKSTGTKKEKGE